MEAIEEVTALRSKLCEIRSEMAVLVGILGNSKIDLCQAVGVGLEQALRLQKIIEVEFANGKKL